ncbi:MFS transporter [Paenibacillus brasilensis]|nr:MFS transporter [Paenibacillus brasilensis]
MIVLSPLAGVLIDRWNRKAVFVVTNMILVLILLLLTALMASDQLQLWHIYVTAFFHSCCTTFRNPTLNATLGMMVDKEKMARVNGLTQSLNATAFICGPLIGAILMGLHGSATLLLINAATFLISAVGALVVAIPSPPRSGIKLNVYKEIKTGAQFLWQKPTLVSLIASSTVFNLFGSFLVVLLIPMSSTVWKYNPDASVLLRMFEIVGRSSGNLLDAQISGTMQAVLFLGSISGGLLIASWGGFKERIWNVVVALLLAIVFEACVSVSNIWIAAVSLFLTGLAGPLCNATAQAIYLSKTLPELQGRVLSLISLLAQLTYPVGLYIVSVLSDFLNPSQLLFGAGSLSFVCCTLFFIFSKVRYVDQEVPNHDVDNVSKQATEQRNVQAN